MRSVLTKRRIRILPCIVTVLLMLDIALIIVSTFCNLAALFIQVLAKGWIG